MHQRVGWAELPETLRYEIEQHAGEFIAEQPLSTGHNCLIGMRLDAANGVYFLKGVPSDKEPAVRTQRFERTVAPLVSGVSPALAFSLDLAGWNVLGFRFLDGYHHADLTPGSSDLDRIARTLTALALISVPDGLELRHASQRYAGYAGGDGTPFAGTVLCHTDLHKHNILVAEGEPRAKLVDWAWPTAGADWIDTACVILQLITEGHTPKQAETWGEEIAPFRRAPVDHVTLFVKAVKNLWKEIADADPQAWKISVAVAANEWAAYRNVASQPGFWEDSPKPGPSDVDVGLFDCATRAVRAGQTCQARTLADGTKLVAVSGADGGLTFHQVDALLPGAQFAGQTTAERAVRTWIAGQIARS